MRRGELTQAMLDHVRASDLLIGDGEPPKEGGWPLGQPNRGKHVPFSVLRVGPATGLSKTLTTAKSKDFMMTYTLAVYAIRRDTCEELDWLTRKALAELLPRAFTDFKALHLSVVSLGAVAQVTNTSPELWGCTDSLEVYCVPT